MFTVQKSMYAVAEVLQAQKAWSDASALAFCACTFPRRILMVETMLQAATKVAGELYGCHTNVLFKPTKAAAQFRHSADAMSYFVGRNPVENGHAEDVGFAINGGKARSDVVIQNHKTDVSGHVAIAMGKCFFTSAADGSKTKVEYTFGYLSAFGGPCQSAAQ